MTTSSLSMSLPRRQAWSAVGSLSLCASLLIAAEFMQVSLLTPIAADLGATEGMAGQAISVSGFFAVLTSLLITSAAGRLDRRHVLMGLTGVMFTSLLLIAAAPNFPVLMAARALLGVTVGGFWALATATLLRLVPAKDVTRALGVLYTGNAVAAAVAAPLGSWLGGLVGWRGVFWAMAPVVLVNLAWQWISLPAMPAPAATPVAKVLRLLRQRHVRFAMLGVMLTFAGAFATFTYFRPFLESVTGATVPQLSLLLLALGAAGFAGTYGAGALLGAHLFAMLRALPLALAAVTVLLLAVGHELEAVAAALVAWGGVNAAIPVAWSAWLARGMADEPESGGGLLVAAIQLAIMLGAALGGLLLDHLSVTTTFLGGSALLLLAALTAGNGRRLRPAA